MVRVFVEIWVPVSDPLNVFLAIAGLPMGKERSMLCYALATLSNPVEFVIVIWTHARRAIISLTTTLITDWQ